MFSCICWHLGPKPLWSNLPVCPAPAAVNMNRAQALKLLRLEGGASDDDINQAFRKMALSCHPDKIGGDGHKFRELGCARDILIGKQGPRPRAPASNSHRFVVYRIEGLTSWKARRVYIGLVDTAKKSVAARVQEHRSRGSSCAAWLRAVLELTWKRVDSAPTLRQGLEKEVVHTGWELRLEDLARKGGGYKTVRGACVVIISEKHARSTSAWQRQLAAARELSVLPSNMGSAIKYLRIAKAQLPRDIVTHLEGRCHICSRQGHIASACPTQTSQEEKAQGKRARNARTRNLDKEKRATTVMKTALKKKGKKSGAQRAKAAKDRGDYEAADKIRFGKKGKKASTNISNKNYREKPSNKARKQVLNEKHNKKQAVKAQKKLYDQSDAAKEKRRERRKLKAITA